MPEQESLELRHPPAWGTYKNVPLAELPADDDENMIGPNPPLGLVESIQEFGVRVAVQLEELADEDQYERPREVGESDAKDPGIPSDEVVCTVLYRVRDGRRRIKAARRAGLEKIKAEVFPPGSTSAALTVIGNAHRSENLAADLDAVVRLAEEHGVAPKRIAVRLGMKEQSVDRLLRMRDLIPPLYEAFRSGDLSQTAAWEAVKLPKSVQEALAVELQHGEKLTVARVREARQVSTRRELQDALGDDAFATPSAEEAAPEPEVEWVPYICLWCGNRDEAPAGGYPECSNECTEAAHMVEDRAVPEPGGGWPIVVAPHGRPAWPVNEVDGVVSPLDYHDLNEFCRYWSYNCTVVDQNGELWTLIARPTVTILPGEHDAVDGPLSADDPETGHEGPDAADASHAHEEDGEATGDGDGANHDDALPL